jgi:hypothetical protein
VSRRHRSWLCATAAALLFGTAIVAAQPARADQQCSLQQPVFAVTAATGSLVEVTACVSGPGLGMPVTVDGSTWRQYRQVFGARDGTTVVLYTVDAAGALWAHRQDAPRAWFGAPVQVGEAVDWSRFDSVFVGKPGYLHAVERFGQIRTFQHLNWSTGGADVSEVQPLMQRVSGPMAAVRWGGFGEAVTSAGHVRIYRNPKFPAHASYDDTSYRSGAMPPGVTGVVGFEPWLYGIYAGEIVQLDQPDQPTTYKRCNPLRWYVAARTPGQYARVVVPVVQNSSVTTPQVLTDRAVADLCVGHGPLEWQ